MLNKTKRRVLFYASMAVFFAWLFPLLFYSLGYGVTRDFRIVKSGGIFLQTTEGGAAFSAGSKTKTTSMLTASVLMKNLLPGKYSAVLSKDGFWPYEKDLAVESERVTARTVVLVPQKIDLRILGTSSPTINTPKPALPGIKKFWRIPGTDDFIIFGEDGKFYRNKEPLDVAGLWGDAAAEILRSKKNSVFDETFSRLIYWDSSVIDSYWIKDPDKLPKWQRDVHHRIGPQRPINSIRSVFSYPGWPEWLVASIDEGVFAIEMDSSGGQNIWPLYEGKRPDIFELKPGNLIIYDDKNYIELAIP